MDIQKKLDKRIKTIVQMTGDYPKEMEISKEEYKQLGQDTFRGVKLKVKDLGWKEAKE